MMLAVQIFRFIVSGVTATAVHFLVLHSLVKYENIDPVAATVLAFSVAFMVSYAFNSFWTFKANKISSKSVGKYLLVSISGMLLNALIMAFAVYVYGWSYRVGFLLGAILVPVLTFMSLKFLVFK